MTIQTVDPRALRDAFGAFPTGVTVVTACDGEGHPIGFTANSFTSVSLNPPLLLVCLAKTSRNFATMVAVIDDFLERRGEPVRNLGCGRQLNPLGPQNQRCPRAFLQPLSGMTPAAP